MNPICAALLLLLALPPLARGHDPGLSSALINLRQGRMEIMLTFDRKDAEQLLQHSAAAHSTALDSSSTEADQNALARLVSSEFRLECDHRRGPIQRFTIRAEDQNNISMSWIVPSDQCPSLKVVSGLLRHLPSGHRQYLAVHIGETQPIAECLLSAQNDALELAIPRIVAAEPPAGPAISFLPLGIKHILTGYDHLLFLFGLLLVTRRFSSALRIISCFTIAHSITLALATLSPVPAPPRLVEPLIAASIVYVGLENLARGGEPKGRWLLTFIFGLIHGCGFASALRELGIGAGGHGVALPLICFNGGVELGQLMIAAILLPLIWKVQACPVFVKRFVPASSAAVVLLGGYWLVQRVLMS
jgi:hydrogenase/urease accessory protein HupE